MNNKNLHPILKEPPLAHALHHWYPKRGLLTYEYKDGLLRLRLKGVVRETFRYQVYLPDGVGVPSIRCEGGSAVRHL